MRAITHHLMPGYVRYNEERRYPLHVAVTCTVETKDGEARRRLSFTGVEGPLRNGDCHGSCGQTGIPADI